VEGQPVVLVHFVQTRLRQREGGGVMEDQALADAIAAVDALNSWVHSESFRNGANTFHSPKKAIYWLKREAISALRTLNLCTHRHVAVVSTCRRCDGQGNFYSWWYDPNVPGYDKPKRCRVCLKGCVDLHFVETHSEAAGIRWHTPFNDFIGAFGAIGVSGSPEPTDWKPNTPGKDATPAEAAGWLNTAEYLFPRRPGRYYHYDGGPLDDFKYSLYVGETDPTRCSFCGSPPENLRYCVYRGRIGWKDFACRSCAKAREAHPFDEFPVPEHLLADPRIQLWIANHRVEQAEVVHG
jgi:hypothetical protein